MTRTRPPDEFEPDLEARRAEFDRLVAPLLPQLQAAARALTGSPEDANDLLQETQLRAWRYGGLAVCHGERHRLHSYLLSAMRNCWYTQLAKRKAARVSEPQGEYAVHSRAIDGDYAAPRERSELIDLHEHLSRAVARLPRQCRRALELIESDKSYQETAEIMNVDVESVSVLVRHARRLLKKDLEALGLYLPRTIKRRAKEEGP